MHILPVTHEHAGLIENLPYFHKDPFDRMIIAQALHENMAVATVDDVFKQYKVKIAAH